LSFEVDNKDIVKLVAALWKESFAKAETNRKSVLTRGWGPKANYNGLLKKEILATKKESTSTSSNNLIS